MIDEKFIQKIGNKDFIKFEGLLNIAHEKGLNGIKTTLLQIPNNEHKTAIVYAECKFKDEIFTGIGDANPSSVGSMIIPHIIRMAETRSIARALRFACNIGICSVDELGEEDKKIEKEIPSKELVNIPIVNKCCVCDKDITDAEKNYSIKFFNKTLCREHQPPRN